MTGAIGAPVLATRCIFGVAAACRYTQLALGLTVARPLPPLPALSPTNSSASLILPFRCFSDTFPPSPFVLLFLGADGVRGISEGGSCASVAPCAAGAGRAGVPCCIHRARPLASRRAVPPGRRRPHSVCSRGMPAA